MKLSSAYKVLESIRDSLSKEQEKGHSGLDNIRNKAPGKLKKQLDEQLHPYRPISRHENVELPDASQFKFDKCSSKWEKGVSVKSRLIRLYSDLEKQGSIPDQLGLAVAFCAFMESAVFQFLPKEKHDERPKSIRALQGGATGLKR